MHCRPWTGPDVARRARADAELVRRGLARSREQAARLIADGRVRSGPLPIPKAATGVAAAAPLHVLPVPDEVEWASRGAHKLLGALDRFGAEGLIVEGRRCLDAGASTGGFTDVLLARGAREVVAADVGYGQLIWRLQNDERVQVLDRTNVRSLAAETIKGTVDLVVADLSFISLRLVLPALAACVHDGADLLPMIKPQFEVGRDRVGHGGVVRDPALRTEAVLEVVRDAERHGLSTKGAVASPLPGPSGNVEYFLWLRREGEVTGDVGRPGVITSSSADTEGGDEMGTTDVEVMVRRAVAEGPQ